jgi:hypothetical protein
MKQIPLTQGEFALVDDEDFEELSRYKWQVLRNGPRSYAVRKAGKQIRMHRQITNAPDGMLVDHRDGNGLNNQRFNLRVCTAAENARNIRVHKDNKTGFKGVGRSQGKYRAYIVVAKKFIFLGRFGDPESAARAYDKAAKQHFGQFARTNF